MLRKHVACLIGSIFVAAASLVILFGVVQADPANATLRAVVSHRNPDVGEVLVVTFTLDTMDPEEAFYGWNVRLGFSSTVLTLVPDSCWFNPGVWFSDTFPITSCDLDIVPYSLYIGEGNLAGHSITQTPMLLGSARFTVNAAGPFGFDIITETIADTNFFRPDNSSWQPGSVRLTDPTAVTPRNLVARGGAGIAMVVTLAIGGASVVLYRRRRHNGF